QGGRGGGGSGGKGHGKRSSAQRRKSTANTPSEPASEATPNALPSAAPNAPSSAATDTPLSAVTDTAATAAEREPSGAGEGVESADTSPAPGTEPPPSDESDAPLSDTPLPDTPSSDAPAVEKDGEGEPVGVGGGCDGGAPFGVVAAPTEKLLPEGEKLPPEGEELPPEAQGPRGGDDEGARTAPTPRSAPRTGEVPQAPRVSAPAPRRSDAEPRVEVVARVAGPVDDFVRTAAQPQELPSDPVEAFDELYLRQARALTRQAFLLSGHRRVAERAVRWAFHQAWQHWPKVLAGSDPTRTVRATVYEYALSPWHQFHPLRRMPQAYSGPPEDRAVLEAFLGLPRSYRAALLLHYGLGLTLPETAAEVECSTEAAAGRVTHGRAALEESWPPLRELPRRRRGAVLAHTLRELAVAQPVRPVPPRLVRRRSFRTTRLWTRASLGLTATVTAATVLTLVTAESAQPPRKPAGVVPRTFAPETFPGASVLRTTRTSEEGRDRQHAEAKRSAPSDRAYLPQLRSTNERVDLHDFQRADQGRDS
ncbi:sigma factor-like helix-turn-helix DNA-binding protein, partial [Streptomyces sp. PU-14G]|uniref:RNA polymerase sigma factor n=1 Tax=Streptomyces sp. PU-14G TaxID=2800808 RepID=UPI0034DDF550